jgi:hypothetical protein
VQLLRLLIQLSNCTWAKHGGNGGAGVSAMGLCKK